MSSTAYEFQVSPGYSDASLADEERQIDELTAALRAARAREAALLHEKLELKQRQVMLAQEFEHRLINGLQVIVSLLSMQSRAASTDEATEQLAAAADRVAALGRVHHRLHLLDFEDHVQIQDYLKHLCDDLSGLLCQGRPGRAIVFEGANAVIPSAIAIPLGLIVNELITNSAKHGNADITVRFEIDVARKPCAHGAGWRAGASGRVRPGEQQGTRHENPEGTRDADWWCASPQTLRGLVRNAHYHHVLLSQPAAVTA